MRQPVTLEHADTLRSKAGVRELVGHVRVRRGETVITADKAIQNPAEGLVILTGAVKLTEPGRILRARLVKYYEVSGNFEASGAVDMTSGDSIRVRCREAKFDDAAGRLELFDNVILNNLSDNAEVTGQRGTWLEGEDVAIIEGKPVYRLPDLDKDPPDTLVIFSDQIIFHRQTGFAEFIGSVRLNQGDMRANADTLTYHPDSSLTTLRGSPVVWQGQDELTGAYIEVHYEGQEVSQVLVQGDAVAKSLGREGDERFNRLSGRDLNITTVDDSTHTVRVQGSAKGYYHIWDEEDVYQGVNLSTAEVIELTIISDRVRNILLEGRSSGAFYPPATQPPEKW